MDTNEYALAAAVHDRLADARAAAARRALVAQAAVTVRAATAHDARAIAEI
jgi:hypothetical protein